MRRRWPTAVDGVRLLLVLSLVSGAGATALAAPSADASAAVDSAQFVFEGDGLELEAGPGQVVDGKTDLTPGTRLSVHITKTSGSPRFILSDEATVAPDGTVRTTFDLADVSVGATVNVSVHHAGTELASTTATVGECTDSCAAPDPATPSVSLSNGTLRAGPGQMVDGETNLPPGTDLSVRVQRLDDDAPDFIYTRTVSVGEGGRFRAPFNLTDAAGATVGVSVHHDSSQLANATRSVVACQTGCEMPPASADRDASGLPENETLYDDLNAPTVTQGGVARIELTFEPENATLTIGGPTVSYALNLSVRDGDDDDRVVVLFATDAIGHGDAAVTTLDDDDSVSVIDERVDGDRAVLDEGEYPIQRSNGPLSTTPDENATTFVVEHGTFLVRDAPIDERGDEPVVERAGLPEKWVDGEYEGDEPVRVRMNETARIPIRTDESKAVTLIVGGPGATPYTLSAVVRDGNGDERVVLLLDTAAADDGGETLPVRTAADDDEVAVTYQNGSMAPATYEMHLYRRAGMPEASDWNDSYSNAGDVFDHGRLIVSESNETPTMAGTRATDTSQSAALPTASLGALALGGVLASAGLAFLTGVIEL
ncbi:MAG: BGTF surface domain-containing protein [Haloferacaceae archaeon]